MIDFIYSSDSPSQLDQVIDFFNTVPDHHFENDHKVHDFEYFYERNFEGLYTHEIEDLILRNERPLRDPFREDK